MNDSGTECIPPSLAPFFQEYRLEEIDPDRAAHTIIERTLRYGNRAELRWLFHRYPEAIIAEWVRRWGQYGLPAPHLAFWRLVLHLDEAMGFFGYDYPLLESTTSAEGVPLASLVDLGLMKMDAIATRASRKDFFDLYAIAQQIPLRRLLDQAPARYPDVRDFESLVMRYLVYFEREEQEAPLSLLQEVLWSDVKAFFRQQAEHLASGWFAE